MKYPSPKPLSKGPIDETIQSPHLWYPLFPYGTYYPRGRPPPSPSRFATYHFYIGGDPLGSHVELFSWHYWRWNIAPFMVFNFTPVPYSQVHETWKNNYKVSWQLSVAIFLNTTRPLESTTTHCANLILLPLVRDVPKSDRRGWQFDSQLWNLLSTWQKNQEPTHRKVSSKPHHAPRGFLSKVGPTGSNSRRIAQRLLLLLLFHL